MAQINSYKIVDDPKSNDRILAYRTSSGETVQIPFSALLDFLPTTLINLTDTPGTYIGQQGKTLSVNNTEDGMEFVPNNLSPSFVTLPDTPASYSSAAGKMSVVNVAENAIEFIDDTFLNATDTPSTYAGSAGFLPIVNSGATALEFIDPEDITPGVIYVTEAADLTGALDSSLIYIISGIIDMGNTPIEVPQGGLNLKGHSFDVSKLVSAFAGYTMFTSPVSGSGNLLGMDYAVEVTGAGSQVYDLVSDTGNEAFEFSRINYNNCTSLGTIDNYRQGLETGTGRFGGTPELTLKGAWSGGYFIDVSIVRNLTDGAYSLYKAGAGFVMTSRFRSNQNLDLNATVSFFDFAPSNFVSASTVQLTDCLVTRNGVFDSSDATLIPNMAASDLVADWDSNNGLPNTFVGGELNITAETTTTISVSGTFVDLAGTWTASDLQHFDEPANGQLRHLGESPVEYKVSGQLVLDSGGNNEVDLKIVIWRDSSSSFVDGKTIRRVINNLQGGRDVAYFALSDNITLNQDDYVKLQVANVGATNNITAELDSFMNVEAR
ncbi:MAG TPA: hypothetical protein EYN67_15450 [Flavobacteriales bacterium]|nr:hypothetical protein [Flavobacteriales bacterium]